MRQWYYRHRHTGQGGVNLTGVLLTPDLEGIALEARGDILRTCAVGQSRTAERSRARACRLAEAAMEVGVVEWGGGGSRVCEQLPDGQLRVRALARVQLKSLAPGRWYATWCVHSTAVHITYPTACVAIKDELALLQRSSDWGVRKQQREWVASGVGRWQCTLTHHPPHVPPPP